MYYSSDMMTDEDKGATIKNGRRLFSDGPLWARARRGACNGEKGGTGHAKAWEGTQAQGGPMRTGQGVRIFGRTTKRSFFFSHKTWVVKCHDSADEGREKDREQKRLC